MPAVNKRLLILSDLSILLPSTLSKGALTPSTTSWTLCSKTFKLGGVLCYVLMFIQGYPYDSCGR